MARFETKVKQGWVLAAVLAMSGLGLGQTGANAGHMQHVRIRRQVLVSIPDRKLAVIENGEVIRVFPVSVGAQASPSPVGKFEIVSRVSNPTYYHVGVVIPPGDQNPIGPRWLGLNQKGYGIHGTNQPNSIGHAASHGCIRLTNREVKELYRMLQVGDSVEIRAQRDTQTALIFHTPAQMVASAATPGMQAGQ